MSVRYVNTFRQTIEAYGLCKGVVGFALLPASMLAGWLWETVSPAAPFYLGVVLTFIAMLALMTLIRE